jgi:hypothetical protein
MDLTSLPDQNAYEARLRSVPCDGHSCGYTVEPISVG